MSSVIQKIFFLSIFILVCVQSFSQANYGSQYDNRGFEEWANYTPSNSNSYEPLDWHAFMSMSGSGLFYIILQNKQIDESTAVRPESSGSKSVRIFPLPIMSYSVNGLMTNGRLCLYGTSLDSPDNYITSDLTDEHFNTPIEESPDSLTIWYSFRCDDETQQGAIGAFVHGEGDFRVKADMTVNTPELVVATTAINLSRTTTANSTDYNWQRISIPIVFTGPCTEPAYILFMATTNMFVGTGSGTEDMFFDDVLLIYNPSLETGEIAETYLFFPVDEQSIEIDIPFTLIGTMSPENLNAPANVVTAQLSDADGNFDNPIEIGSLQTDESGTINALINVADVVSGEGYRIRVVSSNYPMVAEDNGVDITIEIETIPATYIVIVEVFPENAGTVTGTGEYEEGTEVVLEAVANDGFSFVNWTEDGVELSIEPLLSFIVTENRTITANFHDDVGINKIAEPSVKVFPNPASGVLFITSDFMVEKVSVFSLTGEMVLNIDNVNSDECEIDVSSLKSGCYIIVAKGCDANYTCRFLIN